MAHTLRLLISCVVATMAALAVLLAGGCSVGVLKGDSCKNANDKAFATLGGLLTTLISLSVKLDGLDDPKPTRRPVAPK